MLDIQESGAIVAGLHVSLPAGQDGLPLFDKLGKLAKRRAKDEMCQNPFDLS